MSAAVLGCPPGLSDLLRRFIAEEATSTLRHDIRNRLTSLRNGAFYVQRRLQNEAELVERDPRLLKFLQQIDEEAAAIADLLASRLPPAAQVAPAECALDEVTAVIDSTGRPSGVTLTKDGSALRVKGNVGELQLALFCLLDTAVEQSGGGTHLRVEPRDGGWVALQLAPGFTADPDRLGLKISKRAAERWGGKLELTQSALTLRVT